MKGKRLPVEVIGGPQDGAKLDVPYDTSWIVIDGWKVPIQTDRAKGHRAMWVEREANEETQ